METECEQRLWDAYCEKIRDKYGLPAEFDFGPLPEPVSPSKSCRVCEGLICGVADKYHQHVAQEFYNEVA